MVIYVLTVFHTRGPHCRVLFPPPWLLYSVPHTASARSGVSHIIFRTTSKNLGLRFTMSQIPREECTACMGRHRRPYNSRCLYMKLAIEKCVELRCPTSDYTLHLPELDPVLELPDEDDN